MVFHKNLFLCIVSTQERFMIKSRLRWRAYSSYKKTDRIDPFPRTRLFFRNSKPYQISTAQKYPKNVGPARCAVPHFQNGLSYLPPVNKYDNSL